MLTDRFANVLRVCVCVFFLTWFMVVFSAKFQVYLSFVIDLHAMFAQRVDCGVEEMQLDMHNTYQVWLCGTQSVCRCRVFTLNPTQQPILAFRLEWLAALYCETI